MRCLNRIRTGGTSGHDDCGGARASPAGGILWLDDCWDEFADQDKVTSAEEAPHSEAV
jgi:hypothetical protein